MPNKINRSDKQTNNEYKQNGIKDQRRDKMLERQNINRVLNAQMTNSNSVRKIYNLLFRTTFKGEDNEKRNTGRNENKIKFIALLLFVCVLRLRSSLEWNSGKDDEDNEQSVAERNVVFIKSKLSTTLRRCLSTILEMLTQFMRTTGDAIDDLRSVDIDVNLTMNSATDRFNVVSMDSHGIIFDRSLRWR